MTDPNSTNVVRRQVLSYSLRGLFVLFIVVSVPLAIVSQRAQRQKSAVRILRDAGAKVYYDYQVDDAFRFLVEPPKTADASPPGPSWLRNWLGIDYVARVHAVYLNEQRSADRFALLKRLADLPDLRWLDISKCDASPEDYRLLDRLVSLEEFRLDGSSIDDDGIAIVARMPKLRVLDLSNTRIRGPGLRHLAHARSLERLSLRSSRIEADLIEFPVNLPAVHSLDMRNTNLHGDALAPLAGWKQLAILNLENCPLDERAVEHLGRCTSLRQLYLQNTRVNDVILQKLAPLVGLTHLDLSDNDITDVGLSALANMRKLELLRLDATSVAGPGLAHLAALSTLRVLTLHKTLVDDAGAAYLEQLAAVEFLSLKRNPITVAGLPHVARMKSLKQFEFESSPSQGASTFDQFEDLMAWDLAIADFGSDRGRSLAERVALIGARISDSEGDAIVKCEQVDRLLQCLQSTSPETRNAVYDLLASSVLGWFDYGDDLDIVSTRGLPIVNSGPSYRPLILRQRLLGRIVARSRCGLSLPSLDHRSLSGAFSAGETQRFLAPHWRGLPHEDFLADLVGRYADPVDLAVLEVAANPGPTTWQALVNVLPNAQPFNALSAWRQSDPDNAASWFGGKLHNYERNAYPCVEWLESVEVGIACPAISYRPEPPWSDAGAISEAAKILENAKITPAIEFAFGDWSNPWDWQSASESLDLLIQMLWTHGQMLEETGRTSDATRCRETILRRIPRKFIVTAPRELRTVLKGCQLLMIASNIPDRKGVQIEARQLRSRLRMAACYRLAASLTSLACNADRGPPVDKPMMAAWMAGLDHCTDPRAIDMKHAIDEWAALDEQLVDATDKALPAIYLKERGKPLPRDPSGNVNLEAIYASPAFDRLTAPMPEGQ